MKIQLLKTLPLLAFLWVCAITNSQAANAPWVGESLKSTPCRGKASNFGPFDYLNKSQFQHELFLVESTHFLPSMENLQKFINHTGYLVQDLDYTLRAWPNHHRALNSISRYKLLYPRKRKPLSPVECYFQRAINFSPKDATTRMLYGIYLQKSKHTDMAEKQYKKAVELSPNNPIIRYNYGLFLFGQKKYGLAQQQAIIAYGAKFPLNGLKNKLKRVKFWPPKKTLEPIKAPITTVPETIKNK